MEKIASFTIDHIKLQPGIYVSRRDTIGAEAITTFDLRMTSPNEEPVMNTAEVHTIEHLGATFLRNHPVYKEKTIYFGPMGCRTGFYLLLAEIFLPGILFLSWWKCLNLSGISRTKSPALPQGTVEIIWI